MQQHPFPHQPAARVERLAGAAGHQVDDVVVRLGVLEGEFHWHKHDEEDEFFFVLDGLMRIELEGMDPVELGPRQAYVVPKGLRHRPAARTRMPLP
ncbi:MAG: cupin domain-containing protein [Chloroflexi bacterium]|nr:MAG: cupin domain-containing protein [Chloroflexota bacterium]